MNGILNVLKPPGMTSFDVVARIRGLLKTRKVGHCGTLDPLAAGVLPVFIGTATKAIEFFMEKDKHYRACLTLGMATDTQDSSGTPVFMAVPCFSDEEIINAICLFKGQGSQIPPMYSAIKVDGRKLYELAREGIEVERTSRNIEIYEIKVLNISRKDTEKIDVLFDVHCSKGTYIRTLCDDIGKYLGCGGHMSFLLRRGAGIFDLSEAYTLEDIETAVQKRAIDKMLAGVEKVFEDIPYLEMNEEKEKRLRNGAVIELPDSYSYSGLLRVFDTNRWLFAICEAFENDGRRFLRSRKFF